MTRLAKSLKASGPSKVVLLPMSTLLASMASPKLNAHVAYLGLSPGT